MRKQTIAARNAAKDAEHSDANASTQTQPQPQPPQPRDWENEEERIRIPETVAGAIPPSARSSAVSAISSATQEEEEEEEPCTAIHTHPFQTTRIYRSCAFCSRARELLLAQSESEQPKVRFDDRRWKIKLVNRKAWGTRNSTSNSSILSGGGVDGSVGGQSGVGGEADWSQIGDVMGSWVKKRWPGS